MRASELRNIACALSLALLSSAALAQPAAKPIRMVIGFPPGGPIDTVARILAPNFVDQGEQRR